MNKMLEGEYEFGGGCGGRTNYLSGHPLIPATGLGDDGGDRLVLLLRRHFRLLCGNARLKNEPLVQGRKHQ